MPINSQAADYAFDLRQRLPQIPKMKTPSHRVISALQKIDSRIQSSGFREAVLSAIFKDAVEEYFGFGSDEYGWKVVSRLQRRFGIRHARKVLNKRCDSLYCWKYRDGSFLPDGYLIDAENRTIVCYEVEDSLHLYRGRLIKYSNSWWNLEALCWDLHLIAYDIWGHPRIIDILAFDCMDMVDNPPNQSLKPTPPSGGAA